MFYFFFFLVSVAISAVTLNLPTVRNLSSRSSNSTRCTGDQDSLTTEFLELFLVKWIDRHSFEYPKLCSTSTVFSSYLYICE